MPDLPIFWSFRRCPYAMRARLALVLSGVPVELREILLRDKPRAFLDTSPSGTVPALRADGRVLDESLDIMIWALRQADPHGLLDMPQTGWDIIEICDGPFKQALDHTKYAVRYPDMDPKAERAKAAEVLRAWDACLGEGYLSGARACLADYAVLPFVRQFANIDRNWFDQQGWSRLRLWLDTFLASDLFGQIMIKPPLWEEGAEGHVFPEVQAQAHA